MWFVTVGAKRITFRFVLQNKTFLQMVERQTTPNQRGGEPEGHSARERKQKREQMIRAWHCKANYFVFF
jgi:hypothetical protein